MPPFQPHSHSKPRLWDLFITFLVLGIQSFGGGSSTFYLIHQACIDHGWLGEEEFLRTWALAQISPGINLVKLTVLVGYKLRGWPGVLMACAGLLLPSAGVTVLMTAGFASIRKLAWVQAAMKGILPATIGLSLAMGWQMGQPLFARARREGPPRMAVTLFILIGSAALLSIANASPVVVLLLSGAAAVLLFAIVPGKTGRPPAGLQPADKDQPADGSHPAAEAPPINELPVDCQPAEQEGQA